MNFLVLLLKILYILYKAPISSTVDVINASGATDAVNLNFADTGSTAATTSTITYTGGSGVDTLDFGTSLASTDSVDGGGGTDVLKAEFDSGTTTPANITSIETFEATFSGGALNASNLGDLSTIKIQESTASSVISGIQASTSTVSQIANTGIAAINLQYAAGAAATVTINNNGAGATITNAATTVNNVESLTVNANDLSSGAGDNAPFDLASLSGGSVLKYLTVTSSTVDAQDNVDTGNVTAVNLETITLTADLGDATIGTLINADDLTTVTVTNVDKGSTGDIGLGNIGTTTAADDLTSYTVITSGDVTDASATVVTAGILDAGSSTTKSVIETYTINLAGDYNVSTFADVEARTINGINITAGDHGDAVQHTGFILTGSVDGDLNITAGGEDATVGGATPTAAAFYSGETTELATAGVAWLTTAATGSVGNVNLTLTAEGGMMIAQHHSDDIFIDGAVTVGDLNFNTGSSTSGTNDISVGEIDNATTIGNINVSGSGSTTLDGADAATSVGNITVDVDAGEFVLLGGLAGGASGHIGASNGVVGNITGTGAGNVQVAIGPVTTLGNIDLSQMTASTSQSTIGLSDTTTVGVLFTGSVGADTFIGTGGADVIDAGLGADYIQGGLGADLITLTETVGSADTVGVTAAGNATVDIITGFVPGAGGDVIGIDLTGHQVLENNALTTGFVKLSATGNNAADAVALSNNAIPDGPTAVDFISATGGEIISSPAETAGEVSDDGTFLYVEEVGFDAITELANADAITLKFAKSTTSDDVLPGVWYDTDGGFAEYGVITDGTKGTTIIVSEAEWTPYARIMMSSDDYADLTADNFAFVGNMA